MSQPSKLPTFVFVNTLHENPSAQWPKFYREAKQIAYRCMQEYPGYSGGLLFLVLPLAEYNAVPQVLAGGVIVPPAVPLYPADLLPAATASDIANYRINVDLCIHFYRFFEAFKAAVLIAMGESLVQAISDPLAGYAVTIEVLQIFDHLRATYGVLTTGDIRALQAELQVFIVADDMATFVSFAAHFSEVIERLETAGQGLRPFQQMEGFINSTATQPNISKAIEKYIDTNPVLGTRSLPLMIAYVRSNLSNVVSTSAASGYSAMTKNPDAFEKVFADRMAQMEATFAAAVTQLSSTGRPKAAPGKRNWSPQQPKSYCYFHGFGGHSGTECSIMLADRSHFSNRMLNAKTPTDFPGGSTKV